MLKDGPIKRDIDRSIELRVSIARLKLHPRKADSCEIAAAALYEAASEHHSAINLLLRFRRFASAQSLLRSCVETSLRVVWLLQCADEQQVEDILTKKTQWPHLEKVIGSIEGSYRKGGFIRKLLPARSFLNDLAHGGLILVADRFVLMASKDKEPALKEMMEAQIASLCIRTADRMLLLASSVLHIKFGEPEAVDTLRSIYQATTDSYEIVSTTYKDIGWDHI